MKKNFLHIILATLVFTILLAGCGGFLTPATTASTEPPATEPLATEIIPTTITTTPDLCSAEHLGTEVAKVHRHIREFDDASILASNMPREQLSSSIAELQRIRREAEDEKVPPCLGNLQAYQILHMNSVINTLIAFIGGTEQQVLDQGIAIARQQHDQYTLEYARILGITIVPATAIILPSETPTP